MEDELTIEQVRMLYAGLAYDNPDFMGMSKLSQEEKDKHKQELREYLGWWLAENQVQ